MKTGHKNVSFMNILQKMFYKLPQRVHFIGGIKIFIAVTAKEKYYKFMKCTFKQHSEIFNQVDVDRTNKY